MFPGFLVLSKLLVSAMIVSRLDFANCSFSRHIDWLLCFLYTDWQTSFNRCRVTLHNNGEMKWIWKLTIISVKPFHLLN